MADPIEQLGEDILATNEQHASLYELIVGAASDLQPAEDVGHEEKEAA